MEEGERKGRKKREKKKTHPAGGNTHIKEQSMDLGSEDRGWVVIEVDVV